MKTFILFLILSFAPYIHSVAQEANLTKIEVEKICKETYLGLEVDFSHASIHNMNEDVFAIYEPSYNKEKFTIIAKLAEGFNDSKRKPFVIGNFPKAFYTVKVTIISVGTKGDINSKAEILDRDGNIIANVGNLSGDGGTFGSKMNLIGDGCLSTGKALSKGIKKLFKNAK